MNVKVFGFQKFGGILVQERLLSVTNRLNGGAGPQPICLPQG